MGSLTVVGIFLRVEADTDEDVAAERKSNPVSLLLCQRLKGKAGLRAHMTSMIRNCDCAPFVCGYPTCASQNSEVGAEQALRAHAPLEGTATNAVSSSAYPAHVHGEIAVEHIVTP